MSRRLPGPSLLLDAPGVTLDVLPVFAREPFLSRWRERVVTMFTTLGWPAGDIVWRVHQGGATLAFEAPMRALMTATEVNEWAWLGAIDHPSLHAPAEPPNDMALALPLLRFLAAHEHAPRFAELLDVAAAHQVPVYHDDALFTVGAGRWSLTWTMDALPHMDEVPWDGVRAIPQALVTGSNGKTTTVRLLSAMCEGHGWRTGYTSTDGIRIGGAPVEDGDYSGPDGARVVLRDRRVEAAVLETARGGMLRRGLAAVGAQVAVITNIQLDHVGEYGVDALDDLAQVKMVVAKGLAPDGLLVVNADDAALARVAHVWAAQTDHRHRIAWFSLDGESSVIRAARSQGAPCATVNTDGEMSLVVAGNRHVIGDVSAIPITLGGLARYNVANALAASLAAWGMGVTISEIAAVLARFGAHRDDNPGRLMRWTIDGATVLLDYAHNPDGVRGLLDVARRLVDANGQLIVLLGQAGNRTDDAMRALVRVIADAKPARVVVKEMAAMLRGRVPGEVPDILIAELRQCGISAQDIESAPNETDGAKAALLRARPGDVVVLPVHTSSGRADVVRWLDARAAVHVQ